MKHSLAPLAAAAFLSLAAAHAAAAPTYRIKELGPTPHGWASQALAINDHDVVVGWVEQDRNGPQVAAVWQADGGVQTIGTLPGIATSFATAVNQAGQVVGYAGSYDAPQAFLWDAGSGMRALGAFDAAQPVSMANGISDDGVVVGTSVTAAGATHAFTWTAAGGFVDPFPTKPGAVAYAIGTHDEWVGGVAGKNSEAGVRVNAGGKRTDLGLLAADVPYAYGKALNTAGQVVGSSGSESGTNHAFVWDKLHGMQDLGVLPGGTFSNALAVNDAGQVVGISDIPAGRGTADTPFYYDKHLGMVALTTLIADDDPLKSEIQFDAAQAINNRGVIVANGLITKPGYANPRYRAFLLIPTN